MVTNTLLRRREVRGQQRQRVVESGSSLPAESGAGTLAEAIAVENALGTKLRDVLKESSYTPIRSVKCSVTTSEVRLRGVVPSYFLKQIAQELIKKYVQGRVIRKECSVEWPEGKEW